MSAAAGEQQPTPETTTPTAKPKREKRTELAPGVALGSTLFNDLFNRLSREAACRPNVCPSTLAQLAAAWEAEIAIVIGENNPDYNKIIFDNHRSVIGDISLQKIKSQPLRTTAMVFGYETLRPKRERSETHDEDGNPIKRSKKSTKKDKKDSDDDADDEATPQYDAEGNRIGK